MAAALNLGPPPLQLPLVFEKSTESDMNCVLAMLVHLVTRVSEEAAPKVAKKLAAAIAVQVGAAARGVGRRQRGGDGWGSGMAVGACSMTGMMGGGGRMAVLQPCGWATHWADLRALVPLQPEAHGTHKLAALSSLFSSAPSPVAQYHVLLATLAYAQKDRWGGATGQRARGGGGGWLEC